MKIGIFTDVILAPVFKEIKKIAPELEIEEYYDEDLIPRLLSVNSEDLKSVDLIFIHSDQIFHKKPASWQNAYLSAVTKYAAKAQKKILISNSIDPSFSAKPLSGSAGITWDLFISNYESLRECFQAPNVFVFDFNYLCLQIGLKHSYQFALGHLYQMPYTKQLSTLFAERFRDQIRWLFSEEKKAIIVDCDNTLWNGVIGEDGLEGVKCDKNAEGIIFYQLQNFLKAKKEEGFLLCICSKNNESDVKEAFEQKSMPLQYDDFIMKKVNWSDKCTNIYDIASTLNINVDSFIFIDDNPFEINSVSELVTGISVFEFKNDYDSFLKITDSFLFRRKKILKEDIDKSNQYEIEFKRKDEQKNYNNVDDFIQNLSIVLDIRMNDMTDVLRLAQMTSKTNQFNFNKREYSERELQNFMEQGNRLYSLRMRDRFGDYGIVGLMMIEINQRGAIVENFLMSCRSLGKKVEDNFFKHVTLDIENSGLKIMQIRFASTLKNKPAQDFFKKVKDEYNLDRTRDDLSISS